MPGSGERCRSGTSVAPVTDRNGQFARALVAAIAASGVEHACIAPGSRNAPLSLALADSTITDWSHHDERSSGFFALGIARATGKPVMVVTTSGTAAAELHPAVAEAATGRIPLVVVTADRPSELWDVGAAQTIDQRNLFGTSVRWAHDLDVPDAADAGPRHTAALGARLVAEASARPQGPVHLNARFREPLVIEPGKPPAVETPSVSEAVLAPDAVALAALRDVVSGRNGVIIAGPQFDHEVVMAASALAGVIGWPIMSDPISGLRTGAHPVDAVVGSDILAAAGWLDKSSPEAVLRFGAPPTSKAVRRWLAAHPEIPQLLIDPAGWRDPMATAKALVRADVAPALRELARVEPDPAAAEWLALWRAADTAAASAVEAAIDAAGFPTEPGVARAVIRGLPDGSSLWAASSMPIRDIDSFLPVGPRPISIFANRGANGIDGFVSSALGAAAAGPATVALAGDLSMLHDVGALATMSRLDIPLTIVVVNNDGGGIFHFLPLDGHEHFERHFGTPHGLDFSSIATSFGIESHRVEAAPELTELVAGVGSAPRLIEVTTDRSTNVAVHREIGARVAEALEGF